MSSAQALQSEDGASEKARGSLKRTSRYSPWLSGLVLHLKASVIGLIGPKWSQSPSPPTKFTFKKRWVNSTEYSSFFLHFFSNLDSLHPLSILSISLLFPFFLFHHYPLPIIFSLLTSLYFWCWETILIASFLVCIGDSLRPSALRVPYLVS